MKICLVVKSLIPFADGINMQESRLEINERMNRRYTEGLTVQLAAKTPRRLQVVFLYFQTHSSTKFSPIMRHVEVFL